MRVITTAIVRVTDWKALQRLSDQTLIGYARQAGATRYHLFRNLHDASQALLIAEFPDYEALRQMGEAGGLDFVTLFDDDGANDHIWEPAGCESID